MLSGPVAFLHFTFCSALLVEAPSLVNSAGSGSSMLKTRCVGSSLGRSALTDTNKSSNYNRATGWYVGLRRALVLLDGTLKLRLVESLTQFRRCAVKEVPQSTGFVYVAGH